MLVPGCTSFGCGFDAQSCAGDIGWIDRVNPEESQVFIDFDGRKVEYEF